MHFWMSMCHICKEQGNFFFSNLLHTYGRDRGSGCHPHNFNDNCQLLECDRYIGVSCMCAIAHGQNETLILFKDVNYEVVVN